MTWHAIHTKPRCEMMTHRCLQAKGYETLHLHYRSTITRGRKKIGVLAPYFPRYLFCNVEDQGYYTVNKTPGVSCIVFGQDKYFEIPESVIEDIRSRGDDHGLVPVEDAPKHRKRYRVGDRVRITHGPATGLHAKVLTDFGKETIKVLIELFAGYTEATMRVETVSPAGRRFG